MSVRARFAGSAVAVALSVTLSVVLSLTACGGDEPTAADLPADITAARPGITVDEARFVLDARKRGVFVTGDTVADDLESATTTCWALKNGSVTLAELAVDDTGKPLANEGDQLRTKQVMASAVETLCPDYASQIPQLGLPS